MLFLLVVLIVSCLISESLFCLLKPPNTLINTIYGKKIPLKNIDYKMSNVYNDSNYNSI